MVSIPDAALSAAVSQYSNYLNSAAAELSTDDKKVLHTKMFGVEVPTVYSADTAAGLKPIDSAAVHMAGYLKAEFDRFDPEQDRANRGRVLRFGLMAMAPAERLQFLKALHNELGGFDPYYISPDVIELILADYFAGTVIEGSELNDDKVAQVFAETVAQREKNPSLNSQAYRDLLKTQVAVARALIAEKFTATPNLFAPGENGDGCTAEDLYAFANIVFDPKQALESIRLGNVVDEFSQECRPKYLQRATDTDSGMLGNKDVMPLELPKVVSAIMTPIKVDAGSGDSEEPVKPPVTPVVEGPGKVNETSEEEQELKLKNGRPKP